MTTTIAHVPPHLCLLMCRPYATTPLEDLHCGFVKSNNRSSSFSAYSFLCRALPHFARWVRENRTYVVEWLLSNGAVGTDILYIPFGPVREIYCRVGRNVHIIVELETGNIILETKHCYGKINPDEDGRGWPVDAGEQGREAGRLLAPLFPAAEGMLRHVIPLMVRTSERYK